MRLAYADPPYFGCAHYYDHPEAEIYNTVKGHRALIRRLEHTFPDGWALSLSSSSLPTILPLCREDVRVGAWVKPWCTWKPGVNPAYAWEPVIFAGGRPRTRHQYTIPDWIAANATRGQGLIGAKPDAFCFWLFDMLGCQYGDELVDLFPGTGAVRRAWDAYWRQQRLPLPHDAPLDCVASGRVEIVASSRSAGDLAALKAPTP